VTSVDEGREILGQVEVPWLYDRNAFRVTGLAVTASRRDIRRVSDRVKIAERLGEAAAPAHALAPLTPVTPAALTGALDRLRDPRLRLVDEFFWFWPAAGQPAAAAPAIGTSAAAAPAGGPGADGTAAATPAPGTTAGTTARITAGTTDSTTTVGGADDPALSALAGGDVGEARRRWSQAAASDGAARHNLAVLAHLLALDAERAGAGAAGAAPASAGGAGRPDWREVYWLWAAALRDEACWETFEARIAAAGDARLGVGLAAGIRSALPGTLLAGGAALAAAALDAGDPPTARAHLAALRELGEGDADEALRRACEPWLAQVRALCTEADRSAQNNQPDGADIAERLLADAEPTIARIDELLPAENPARAGVHDQVGQTVLTALLFYDQSFLDAAGEPLKTRTPDHFRMRELLRRVIPLVESAALTARLQDNLAIVERQAEAGACWYCEKRRLDKDSSLSRPLHRVSHTETTWNGRRIHYQSVTVTVPRCAECARAHRERRIFAWLGALSALILIIAVATVLGAAGWGVFVGIVVALVVGTAARGSVGNRTNQYPPLVELRVEGWHPGAKPAGS
jgi:hypothetical protein